ncbi:unnamed protein product [Lactuca virosa]|uniref:TF-B3 domain-containing protein n=1 Tax=Lactuca virosa TaxID=75947 RepID=A0AAU9LX64_9ASTR|nr:unnamed protein product [Lactuca virosa]
MNFKYGDEASFFKILTNDSDDYLLLPPAFAEKYLEKDNNKRGTVILKNKSAVEWSVKYFKIKDKYYFMDGWVKFMRDNRLQICDLLVFSLLSPPPNSIFQVVVYAPNGCFKHPICSSDLPFKVTKEQRSRNKSLELVKSFKSDKPFYSVTMKLSYLRAWGLYVPITFLRRYLLSNDEISVNCVLEVSDGRKWGPIICTDYKTCGRLSGPNWKKFREDNQLGLGDVCVLELMNEMEKVLKVTIFGSC